jgi:hypothetical protein
MRGVLIALIVGLLPAGAAARVSKAPLYDPVMLNIGFVCQWEHRCMVAQNSAMKRSVSFVRKRHPPEWRVALCNRNASRKRQRVDWVGFEHCIRNPALRPSSPMAGRNRR